VHEAGKRPAATLNGCRLICIYSTIPKYAVADLCRAAGPS
jgi:hypothetical protein